MSDLLDFSPPGQVTFSLAGAKARFFDAGTTTPRTVYTDQTETVPHPVPLLADGSGRFPQAFASGGAIKVVVTQADDSTGYTLDPCEKVAASGSAASQIGFSPTLALPFDNVQAAIEGAAASAASGFTPFGLGVTGSVALLANIDATNIASGQYRFDGSTTGTYPTGVAAADTGAIALVREASGSAWMWLYHDTTDRVFIRRMNSSTWGAWRENTTANIGATQGDLIFRGASNFQRLAIGTAGQVLQVNSGATAPEWAANPSPVKAWVNFHGTATNGTYSRTGNTVTVTMTSHGMSTGMVADLNFTTGTATDGSYTVTVTDANTFTVTDTASGSTSGNVTRNNYIRASLNVSSITDNSNGNYTVNFTSAISDAFYAATVLASSDVDRPIPAIVSQTTSALQILIESGANVASDADVIHITVVR